MAAAYKVPTSESALLNSANVKVLQQISDGVSEISREATRAVVFVSISKTIKGVPFNEINPFDFFFGPQGPHGGRPPQEQKQKGLGSGFFVDLEKGYILTNNHVIEGADEIMLKLANGQTYPGTVLGRDENTDVAVVQVKDPKFDRKTLSELHLGDSDQCHVGEFVVALGAPFGLEASTSFGVLSALGRGNLNITNLGNFLQTDAAINPGNSGGPLLNSRGLVIGINTAIFSRSGSSAGIGFAVPSSLVRVVAEQLINKGSVERGYLGVRLVQELDDDIAAGLGLPEGTEGALVASVQPATPAEKGGLEAGDVVITVNGKKVQSNADLTNNIGLLPPGTVVPLAVLRSGKTKTLSVTLSQYPNAEALGKVDGNEFKNGESLPAGLSLKVLDPKDANFAPLKQRFSFTSKRGLLVTQVAPDSKGEAAGIRPGDVLLSVNKKELKSIDDFKRGLKDSARVLIQLEREGTMLFAAIRK
jgi:serine protease Do